MRIHGALVCVRAIAKDLSQYALAREHLARRAGEQLQQPELRGCQQDRLATKRDLLLFGVYDKLARAESNLVSVTGGLIPL